MSANPQSDYDFGNVLVELGIVPIGRVREALQAQRRRLAEKGTILPLEEILIGLGYLTSEQADRARERLRAKQAGTQGPIPQELPGYTLLRKLGSGAMGTVYLAKQLSMERPVAIKLLPPRLATDPTYVERFKAEARSAAKLNHPNVVTGYDVGEHQGVHYFVMEYIDGTTVRQVLDEKGRLDEPTAVDVGLQVAKALEAAHRVGLVHRDVKPENLMMTKDGTVKLCDLGLAREAGMSGGGAPTKAIGTPRYISPEQAKGDPLLDIRCDLYALGATLYHLVTGELPFPADTPDQMLLKHVKEPPTPPKQKRPEIGEKLNAIILKLMQKDRANRYQSPADLVAALQPLSEELKRTGPRISRRTGLRSSLGERRRTGWRGGGAALAVAIVLGAAAFILSRPGGGSTTALPPVDPRDPEPAGVNLAERELERLSRAAGEDPVFANLERTLKQFEGYLERHDGTEWAARGTQAREEYLRRAEAYANGELTALRKRDEPLRAEGKWRDLLKLYESWPAPLLETTPAGREVKEERERIRSRATEQLVRDRARIRELVDAGRFSEALALAEKMEGYALDPSDIERLRSDILRKRDAGLSAGAREVSDRYLPVEQRCREYAARRDFRLAIGAIAVYLSSPWTEPQKAHVFMPDLDYAAVLATLAEAEEALARRADAARACALWEAVAATCETFAGDPETPSEVTPAQRVLIDLRNFVSLELFRHEALAGVDRLVRGRESVVLQTQAGRTGTFEVRAGKFLFVPADGAPVTLDPWRDLSEPDLVALASRTFEGTSMPARFWVRVGLLYLLSKGGAGYAARAHEALSKAADLGARGVRIYLGDLHQLMKDEAAAQGRARYEESVRLFQQRDFAGARSILAGFQDRTDDEFLRDKAGDIRKMLAEAEAALEEERRLKETYLGRAQRLPDGRVQVAYDFSDPAQWEAFEVLTLEGAIKGRWYADHGMMESTKLPSAVRWRHRIKGPVTVEYSVMPLEGPQNVVTSLYYNLRQDRHYSLVFGFDLVTGSSDPKDVIEDRRSVPRTCLLKYPTGFDRAKWRNDDEWAKLRDRIVGSAKAEFHPERNVAYRILLLRDRDWIRAYADGKLFWEGKDKEYDDGYLLFYSDSRTRIDDVVVTFKP